MSVELIKYAFVAGEVSKTYIGRSDLEQYDFGLALAKNWFVDYRGGLSTRPGQDFCDYMFYPDSDGRFFEFKFSPDTTNTYLVVFENTFIKFMQDGAYVLEGAMTVTATNEANPTTFTAPAHGFAVGDWVRLSGYIGRYAALNSRTFQVTFVSTNTFRLKMIDNRVVSTLGWGPISGQGVVARVYTIPHGYATGDLPLLRAYQIRDTLRLTHPNYPVKNLVRSSHTSWAISNEVIGNSNARPQNIGITYSAAGTSAIAVAVTAIDADGNESLASNTVFVGAGVNYSATAGWAKITWDVVPGAARYRIYRSAIVDQGQVNRGMQLGYIGATQSVEFVDNNIVPDYTKAPPEFYNPFANGAIRNISVTNGGTGYTISSVLSVTGGTGFLGNLVVAQTPGTVAAVGIINGGQGYTAPGYSITVGSGATLSFDVSPASGNYPSVSCVFQQRQIYAASYNQPLTVWGSRPGNFKNFDASSIINDGDSYEFDLDSDQVSPIRHLLVVRGGLMLMTQTGVWLLSGGGTDTIVTPTNALAQPQTYTGVALVPPVKINTDLLYIEGKGTTVRMLAYNEYSRVYSGDDVSILSNHLMTINNQITQWAYAENPFKVVWAVREDGAMLGFTVVKEQKVFAWTQHWTKGYYQDVLAIQEDGIDKVYVATKRTINGVVVKFIERQNPRDFELVEDAVCVDASLSLRPNENPGTTLFIGIPNVVMNRVNLATGTPFFNVGMVGNVIRASGGKFVIETYTDSQHVTCIIKRMPTKFVPEDTSGIPQMSFGAEWSIGVPTSILRGLDHLEGETVSILGDGNVFPQQTVVDGAITLTSPVTIASIGLPYTCVAQTLPPTTPAAVIEGKRKRIPGIAARLNDTRGLELGPELDQLYEMKDRTNEVYGEPIELRQGISYQLLNTNWDEEGQTYLVQQNPLPATILSLVYDMEIGDDSN